MIVDQNEWFRSLNAGLPDDVARLKAAGYYREAIERIDAYLAEDWTAVQNGPNAGANPAPGGVDTWRAALRAQREMMRRLPAEYIYTEQQAVEKMQARVTGFTLEELRALDRAGRIRELARLHGGDNITETTLRSAGEQLDAAYKFKMGGKEK